MSKNLIIVESPTKTRTLKKFLGGKWDIQASVGHIRDLEKKNLGISEDYEPRYRILPEKQDVVKKLRAAAKKADTVFLAPDPDREGEAIAWHIAEILNKDPEAIRRVTFNEITQQAVLAALEDPGAIDFKKVEAQQARRILDRLMGFKLSPLLWEKVKRGLSAGRVQSVALKMVCDRQAEIDAFQPVEYWHLDARLEGPEPPPFVARLHRIDDKKAVVGNGDDAARIVEELRAGTFRVHAIERKESKQKPTPPFITSRLQQEAARRFGFSVKRTMGIAQGLYEGREIGSQGAVGLITYMRTDSTRVAEEALTAGREFIAATYGADQMPKEPNRYKTKKGSQDAHEAIRPTTFDLPPDKVAKYLKPEEAKLYQLIWNRFIASQMVPAIFDTTRVDVENGNYLLRAKGRVLKSPGFLAVYKEVRGEARRDAADAEGPQSDDLLPELTEGAELKLEELTSEQKFTKPPARFSEATLVRALEDNGIGRPSTYASILSTLTDRSYVQKVERRFAPTVLGKFVNKLLQGGFSDILNEGYTASLEEDLDQIEEGKLDWRGALESFDRKLSRDLETATNEMPNVKKDGVPTDEICPKCSSPLVMRFGRYGAFYGCTGYPECDHTSNVEEEGQEEGAEGEAEDQEPCEKCGKPMVKKRSRYGSFWGCSAYPECKNIRRTGPAAEPPKGTGISCPECGEGEIAEKRSRRGKIFYSCNRYPDCKFALWNPPVDRACPQCDSKVVTKKVTKKKGPHLACPKKECDWEESLPAEGDDEEAN